jgi:cbb3-type cytochrome oxidase maturation protein
MTLAMMWLLYSGICVAIFAALFLWAIRAGQFRDQDRARRLPLHHPPEEEE